MDDASFMVLMNGWTNHICCITVFAIDKSMVYSSIFILIMIIPMDE